MPNLALLLDIHPDQINPERSVQRIVVGPFKNHAQIEDELARTHHGAEPFRKVRIIDIPDDDPEGVLTNAEYPITTTAIFTVTTIQARKVVTDEDRRWAEGKDQLISSNRTPGFYPSLPLAKRCVENNWGDIQEGDFNYALIEEIPYGLYPTVLSAHWYKWNATTKAYEACHVPDWMYQTRSGFAIG